MKDEERPKIKAYSSYVLPRRRRTIVPRLWTSSRAEWQRWRERRQSLSRYDIDGTVVRASVIFIACLYLESGARSSIEGGDCELNRHPLSNRRCYRHGPDVDGRCFVDVNVDWARVFVRLILDQRYVQAKFCIKIQHMVLKLKVSTLRGFLLAVL